MHVKLFLQTCWQHCMRILLESAHCTVKCLVIIMGVDIDKYLGRIGTFKYECGQDFKFVRTVGTVVFIGLLLLIAGIESNPGPGQLMSYLKVVTIVVVALSILFQGIEWNEFGFFLVCILFLSGLFDYVRRNKVKSAKCGEEDSDSDQQLSSKTTEDSDSDSDSDQQLSRKTTEDRKHQPGNIDDSQCELGKGIRRKELKKKRKVKRKIPTRIHRLIKGLFTKETLEPKHVPERSKINIEEYKKEHLEKGVAGVKEKLSKELQNWNNIELHTAVVGNSGSGKSSFINSIRGLKHKQPGAAKVGAGKETTTSCKPYRHPENNSFVVWDIPGVGTPNFTRENYLQTVKYERYDFFIIISKDRFTENDLWLALEVQQRNKTFFFVRSNIDTDIEKDRVDNSSSHDEKAFLQEIRQDILTELGKHKMKTPKVFLISNWHTDKFDFGKLNNELLLACDGLKRDSLALSLAAVTKEVMEEKKRILEGRINQVALHVASSRGNYEQKGRFEDEIKFYQKQFDIDDVTLAENKDILKLSKENLQEFKVIFDDHACQGQMPVETPTAMREQTSRWHRFKDFFTLSKEETLLYNYCRVALRSNLEELYQRACSLYDLKRTTQIVHAVTTKKLT